MRRTLLLDMQRHVVCMEGMGGKQYITWDHMASPSPQQYRARQQGLVKWPLLLAQPTQAHSQQLEGPQGFTCLRASTPLMQPGLARASLES